MVQLADQGYSNVLRALGNKPGDDRGDVTVVHASGLVLTMDTRHCAILGELGVLVRYPDGRHAFWPMNQILEVADASPENETPEVLGHALPAVGGEEDNLTYQLAQRDSETAVP